MEFLPAAAAIASAPVASNQHTGFLPSASGAEQLASSTTLDASSFSALVSNGLGKVNDQLVTSQQDLQRLALGDAQNLHQIMIQLEETRMSFQLMMQVRNRLLEAYQDVMKMSV